MPATLRGAAAFTLAAILLGSCSGGGTTTTTTTQSMVKNAGDAQTALVSSTLPINPSVKITDQNGAAVAGVGVVFAVASGGGFIVGSGVTTNSSGIATVAGWTLGSSAGANTLTATAANTSGSPVTFTATATAPVAPKTLTKQAGDAQTATVGTAVAIAPSVKVVDVSGNPLVNTPVFFTVTGGGGFLGSGGSSATANTNSSGIATVSGWTMGAAVGANTLSATTGASGVTGDPAVFTATGVLATFSPSGNTTLSGTVNFASVNIPAGVTVTVSNDLVLTTTGAVTIAGTLSADCKAISITATTTFNMSGTGTVDNRCTTIPTGTPPALSLVGLVGYHITGTTTIASMGDILVTNDLTLPSSIIGGQTGVIAPVLNTNPSAFSRLIDYDCEAIGATFTKPAAQDGTNGGQTGTDGKNAKKTVLSCRGNGHLDGTTVNGRDGGKGGTGTHTSATAATATGGIGGDGALLVVHVTAQLDFTGTNTLNGGNGGDGGSATATGTSNPTTPTGPPATATGGNGGQGGLITVRGLGGITVAGVLTLNVGHGGKGGDATAVAADGVDAGTAAAQPGGAASAIGGNGGGSPVSQLTVSGNVSGGGTVSVTGGNGALSGLADATGGKGGNGNLAFKDGAVGGPINAAPGRGGTAQARNLAGTIVGSGGTSADAFFRRGLGGLGYVDCTTPITSGGNGGKGGDASGGSRFGGTGTPNGADGVTREIVNSDGGNGGSGMGPGNGGAAGTNNIIGAGVAVVTPAVFTPGTPGSWCPLNKTAIITITNPITDDPQNHESVLQFTSAGRATVFSANGQWTQLFPGNAQVALNCTYNTTTGVIHCTQQGFTFSGRSITNAVFDGTWNGTQLIGDLTLTVQNQPSTVKYHIVDP